MTGIGRSILLAFGAAAMALASGCAMDGRSARVSTYGAPYADGETPYAGGDRIFAEGYAEALRTDSRVPLEIADAQMLADYQGVDGARLAHRLFGEARAEQLDGACEPYVKITQNETLYDISQFCDVPISMLIESNPVIRNPRHVEGGQIIEIPQVFNPDRRTMTGTYQPGVQLASWYVVQPGDTLNDIAARHLVSASSIAKLNPHVDWNRLSAGAQLRIPAEAAAGAAPGAAPPVEPAATAYPYGGALQYGGPGEAGYAAPEEVTAVMPYASPPPHAANEETVPKSLMLAVDRRTVRPGGDVVVSAVGLPPNSSVSLYSGPNGGDLKFVKTVTTDAEGKFSESVKVSAASDLGGVIFRAMIDKSGKQLQSPRVGVDKIKPEK